MIPMLRVIKLTNMDYILSRVANNRLVSVTDACRRLVDVGHTCVLLVSVELDVAFRAWPL